VEERGIEEWSGRKKGSREEYRMGAEE